VPSRVSSTRGCVRFASAMMDDGSWVSIVTGVSVAY
jgi:hypothetical protein